MASSTTVPININGITVNFPASGDSPNWSPAVIQAIELIAEALTISAGPFDIPPQNFVMTSNVNTNVPIPNLEFPVSAVQGSIIFYGVQRSTNSTKVSQSGILILNYDPTQSPGSLWQITDEFASANSNGADITFNVTDVGQLQFSTTSIAGTGHTGTINFRALAVLNS
jgi:hypothetical protein